MPSYEQIMEAARADKGPLLFEARAEAGLPLADLAKGGLATSAPPAWLADALGRATSGRTVWLGGINWPLAPLLQAGSLLPALAFAVVSRCPVGSGAFVRFRRDETALLGFSAFDMRLPAPLAVVALHEAVAASTARSAPGEADLDLAVEELAEWLSARGVATDLIDDFRVRAALLL